MKAIEFLDRVLRENLQNDQSGLVSGVSIIANTPQGFFNENIKTPSWVFDEDYHYFYYYGIDGETFAFLPDDYLYMPENEGTGIYVWKVEQ